MSEERYCPVCGVGTSVMCVHLNRLVDAILYGVPDDVAQPTESGDKPTHCPECASRLAPSGRCMHCRWSPVAQPTESGDE